MTRNTNARWALIFLGALIGLVLFAEWPRIRDLFVAPSAEPRIIAARGDLAEDERATIDIFEARRDSVVSISTTERVVDLFTRDAYNVPRGTGSGFVWDDRGHIVTNAHVVENASSAIVRLADGRAYRASVVGVDPNNDLAVLRVGVGRGRPEPIPIGTSDDLQVGQKVLAVGNPFGLDWTLTTGIISALDRELPSERGGVIRELIQTDAAINPGNSGGPLIDSAGRLIGVNTAIFSPSGSSAGIGFAVPVDTVNRVVPQLIASGQYRPPSLGISIDPRTDEMVRRMGLSGVLILGVTPGSAAERAGLKPARLSRDGSIVPGDLITGLGEMAVDSVSDLRAALDRHRPGEEVELQVWRSGSEETLTVTLDA